MSLLSQGRQNVTVYPEETVIDSDGNTITRSSLTGIELRASVQPLSSTEDVDGGFVIESRYRLRLAGQRGAAVVLGPRALLQWRGRMHSIDGDATVHESSRQTEHATYIMVRS